MFKYLLPIAVMLCLVSSAVLAEEPAAKKPPVGVPNDAKLFNGKWYRVYIEPGPWKAAKAKCERLGGQLAVIHDEPTQVFIRGLADDALLWLGALEKAEGVWQWVDGSPMTFKAWFPGQPDLEPGLQMLHTWKGGWGDIANDDKRVAGYICEWKAR